MILKKPRGLVLHFSQSLTLFDKKKVTYKFRIKKQNLSRIKILVLTNLSLTN